jgi:hypothetical protein
LSARARLITIVDDDGSYAALRRFGRELRPRIDAVITHLIGVSAN